MGLFSDLRKRNITGQMLADASDAARRLTPLLGDGRISVTSVSGVGTAIALRPEKVPPIGKEVIFTLETKIAGRSGVYGASIIFGRGEDTGSGRVSSTIAGGKVSAGEIDAEAHHINESDSSLGDHLLAVEDRFYRGFYTGEKTSAGLPIIVFAALPFGEATTDIVAVGDTDEGSEAADTTEWARGDGPLTLQIMTRVAYFHAGDKKLYGYIREYKWDAIGMLLSVSGETRIELDAATTCT
jgi:hypothetical protein